MWSLCIFSDEVREKVFGDGNVTTLGLHDNGMDTLVPSGPLVTEMSL